MNNMQKEALKGFVSSLKDSTSSFDGFVCIRTTVEDTVYASVKSIGFGMLVEIPRSVAIKNGYSFYEKQEIENIIPVNKLDIKSIQERYKKYFDVINK